MSDVWAACPLQSIRPTSTQQKILFTQINPSLIHFNRDIKVQMNAFCAKTFKATIIGCHRVTVALRELL